MKRYNLFMTLLGPISASMQSAVDPQAVFLALFGKATVLLTFFGFFLFFFVCFQSS